MPSIQEIGMSPDYRSGVSELVVCEICDREMPPRYAEHCAYCGRSVCHRCYVDHISGVTCLDCLPLEE